jgi:hypothetical protein
MFIGREWNREKIIVVHFFNNKLINKQTKKRGDEVVFFHGGSCSTTDHQKRKQESKDQLRLVGTEAHADTRAERDDAKGETTNKIGFHRAHARTDAASVHWVGGESNARGRQGRTEQRRRKKHRARVESPCCPHRTFKKRWWPWCSRSKVPPITTAV